MIPEAGLIAVLVIVFLADLILKGEKKHSVLSLLTGALFIVRQLSASMQNQLLSLVDAMSQLKQPML